MPVYLHPDSLEFPPLEYADEDGLLAVGGDLRVERILAAYRLGIFPWFNKNEPILWWCPDPRFVLFPEKVHVSKSMARVLRGGAFEITQNTNFEGVIRACSKIKRRGQRGTWLIPEMMAAYTELHRLGFAQSVEAWQDGKLVGGFYGIKLGRCFFGESMFSEVTNASKAAFLTFVQQFQDAGGVLIDCQVHTSHLESLGAEFIPRDNFRLRVAQHSGDSF
ncbi:MAG: leucyl/phenylalanyl-tRNA--protein transferase [Bacteroidia bacterium]